MDHHNFKGKDIPHIKLNSKTNIKELVEIFANSGFNARQLGEAAKLYAKMIHQNATICLTASGALTPVGFGGIIKTLLEKQALGKICHVRYLSQQKRNIN